ncbi:hypothetical protein DXG01_010946 [Tephrocybe rancida]|nr:hypothetical protein DXG01_010946 [Tephrocybe rancida]
MEFSVLGNESVAGVLCRDKRESVLSLTSLKDRRFYAGMKTEPNLLTSFTLLGGKDSCVLTTNVSEFSLDLWQLRKDKFTKIAILALPPLLRADACRALDCRPLDSVDPKVTNGDPYLIIDCKLLNGHATCIFLVKLSFLKEIYRSTAMSSDPQTPTNPQTFHWSAWGEKNAMFVDAYNRDSRTMAKGMYSGHTFCLSTKTRPRDSREDVLVSFWDLRKLGEPTLRPISLCAPIPPSQIFTGQILVRHLQDCPPTYRTRLPFDTHVLCYEGFLGEFDLRTGMVNFYYTPSFPDFDRQSLYDYWAAENAKDEEFQRRLGPGVTVFAHGGSYRKPVSADRSFVAIPPPTARLTPGAVFNVNNVPIRGAKPKFDSSANTHLVSIVQISGNNIHVGETMETRNKDILNFGIAPQALAKSNVDTSTLTFLDNDTENLNLLAHFCSAFLNDASDDSSTSLAPESPITIATPVPLPYSARSSEVLERMISGPKERLVHPLALAEKLEREESNSESDRVKKIDGNGNCDTPAGRDSDPPEPATLSSNRAPNSQLVFRPIRPVSPSTLIALTEPCLMAWSSRPPEKLVQATPSHLCAPLRNAPSVFVPVAASFKNDWGY